jgi:hypothetical protein
MAIVAPMFVSCEANQALGLVVTVAGVDASAYALAFKLRGFAGATPLVTKTSGSGIVASYSAPDTTVTVTLTESDLTLAPGLYEWTLERTDAGVAYPVVDRSGFEITAASGAAYPKLTNLSAYLASLGLAQTAFASDDAGAIQHQWALEAAESALKRACNRQFTYSSSRTEYLSPSWTPTVSVKETPVESITSIYYDLGARGGQNAADFATATLQTLGDDYYLFRDRAGDNYSDSGLIYRVGGVWQGWQDRPVGLLGYRKVPAVNCLKVTYAGGYGNAVRPPVELLNAIHEAATLIRKAAREGRLAMSQSGEGESVSYAGMDIDIRRLGGVQSVIGMYRRVVI